MMTEPIGHLCPKCGKRWANGSCLESPSSCNGDAWYCPTCIGMHPNILAEWEAWKYLDDFTTWVIETYLEGQNGR